MKLSQHDKSLLFSSTEISDVFFTEYLPEAKGDYIKVYFYMLFLSKYNKEIKIKKINHIITYITKDTSKEKEMIQYLEEKDYDIF